MALQWRKISGDKTVTHYFLCHYVPQSSGSDHLSRSLIGFKTGQHPHREAWIECSAVEFDRAVAKDHHLILRALANDERKVNESLTRPMDRLGIALAGVLLGDYQPHLLYKSRITRPLKLLSKDQREAELKDVYRFTNPQVMPPGILIVDDIFTTGATINAIITAIRLILPDVPLRVFTLAYTDYDRLLNEKVKLYSAYYSWNEKEWAVASEPQADYRPAYDVLKQCIMQDSFQ